MKIVKKISLVFALAIAATISSCGGDDESAPAPLPANGTFIMATVGGVPFSSSSNGLQAATTMSIGTGVDREIIITGVQVDANNPANSKSIIINLEGINSVGQITVNPSSDSFLDYIEATNSASGWFSTDSCSGATGTITITEINATKIEGTFLFTAKNDDCSLTKVVTAGSFRGVFTN